MSNIRSLLEVERGDASVTRVVTLDDAGNEVVYYRLFSYGRDYGSVWERDVPALLEKLRRGEPGSPARDTYEALLVASGRGAEGQDGL